MAPRSAASSISSEQEPAADAAPAPGRQHRERRHVRLVDHEPDARVGDESLAGADHEVVRHAVGLELLAEGVGRPGRREARRSRWRARPGCRRRAWARRGASPEVGRPSQLLRGPGACRAAAPRRPARAWPASSSRPAARRSRAEREERRRAAPRRARLAESRGLRARAAPDRRPPRSTGASPSAPRRLTGRARARAPRRARAR